MDCSRPKNISVNNSTNNVKLKFSYKALANVAELLQHRDFIDTVDIKDAYRAVSVYP